MNKKIFNLAFTLFLSMAISGCLVRTYTVKKERVDQKVAGNQGYLQGNTPKTSGDKKKTRETLVVEIELKSPVKFGKEKTQAQQPKEVAASVDEDLSGGNQGFVAGSPQESMKMESMAKDRPLIDSGEESMQKSDETSYTQYTVQKGDTLQKISKKFYGRYSKWSKIYNANKEKIKNPDSIAPGQVLNIPQE